MIFLYFVLTGILGGTTGSLIKYTARDISPVLLVFLRLALSVIIFFPFAVKYEIKIPWQKWKLLLFSSIFLISNILLFSIGVRHTSAIMSQLIYVPTSLIVAFLGYIFVKEKLTPNQVLGLIITIFGMAMLAQGSLKTGDLTSFGEPFGNLLITIGLFSWAFYFVTSRKLVKEMSPLSLAFVNTTIAFLISLFIIPAGALFSTLSISFHLDTTMALIASSITSVAFLFLSQSLIKKTSAFVASLITYINPLAATVWGIMLFQEKPTISLALSSLVVIAGVFTATTYNYVRTKG